ncbi:hypothetical protein HDU85_006533 [Gaertneriomyces sp. JEL0708]|nr:hypothetical protein HDU85_006533 [Gaertneriomyces sp. JEL0708]
MSAHRGSTKWSRGSRTCGSLAVSVEWDEDRYVAVKEAVAKSNDYERCDAIWNVIFTKCKLGICSARMAKARMLELTSGRPSNFGTGQICGSINYLSNALTGDIAVRYICRRLISWVEKQLHEPREDSNERTIDPFCIVPYAVSVHNETKLRYGEKGSKADKADKRRRETNSTSGKKLDYHYSHKGAELGVGENSAAGKGSSLSVTPAEETFVDNVKTAIAQIRHHTFELMKQPPHSQASVLAGIREALLIPTFQYYKGELTSNAVLPIAGQLYAVVDIQNVQIPESATDVLEFLKLCEAFVIFDVLVQAAHAEITRMKDVVAAATIEPKRRRSLMSASSRGRALPMPQRKSKDRQIIHILHIRFPHATPKYFKIKENGERRLIHPQQQRSLKGQHWQHVALARQPSGRNENDKRLQKLVEDQRDEKAAVAKYKTKPG